MNMRIILISSLSLLSFWAQAQMRFGVNTALNPNAVVQIDTAEGTRKGLLMPRLALKTMDNFFPLGAHVAGMVVFNTATAGTGANAVSPGYFYNDGTRWNRILSQEDISSIWKDALTGKPATSDTQNVYRMGKLGIGVVNPTESIDVKGNVKVSNGTNTGSASLKSGTSSESGQLVINSPSGTMVGKIGMDTVNLKYQTLDTTKHHVFAGGRVGIGTTANPQVRLEVNGAIKLGNDAGTTESPAAGMIRYNATLGKFEGYNGTAWVKLHD